MCWPCILFYILSGALGLFLGKILFGKSKDEKKLLHESSNNKLALDDLLTQFQKEKNEYHENLLLKDAQITKRDDQISSFKSSGSSHSGENPDNKVLLNKIKQLKAQLESKSTSPDGQNEKWEEVESRLKTISKEYEVSQKLIHKLRKENKELIDEGQSQDAKTSDNKLKKQMSELKAELNKKNQKISKLKADLKKTSQKLLKNIEITETINMKKLISLLKKGKLSSLNKKVSRKKSS